MWGCRFEHPVVTRHPIKGLHGVSSCKPFLRPDRHSVQVVALGSGLHLLREIYAELMLTLAQQAR